MNRKRYMISWITLLCLITAMFPAAVFAAWDHGDKGTADFTKILIGKDGKEYYINENVKTVFYGNNGKKTVKPGNGRSKVRWRYLKITNKTSGTARYGYCAEFGAGFDDTAPYKASHSSKDENLFQNLPVDARKIIAAALCYGRNGSRAVPVSSANDADYYFATQVLIWEAQQGLRTIERKDGQITGTKLASAHSMPAKHMYGFLKGRPAEKCYNWLLKKVNGHLKDYSFTAGSSSTAPVHQMQYDKKTETWSITLTDSAKKENGMILSDSRIKVNKSGNHYTFQTKQSFSNPVTVMVTNKMSGGSSSGKLLAWNCTTNTSNQSIITGSQDLTEMYLKFKTEEGSSVTILKQDAETGKPVTDSSAVYEVIDADTGKQMVKDLKTDKTGKATIPFLLYPGTYQIREAKAPDGYQLKKELQFFKVEGNSMTVVQENSPEKGRVELIKLGISMEPSQGKMIQKEIPLEGAVFQMRAAEDIITGDGTVRIKAGETACTLTTDHEGRAVSDQLYLGKYQLIEIKAPDGYILSPEPQEIRISAEDTDKEGILARITVCNEQIIGGVEIMKTDVSTGNPLPDTGIEILDQEKNSILKTRTDSQGKAIFQKLPKGKYFFREFDAPKGYQIDNRPFPFEIKENGEIVKCQMTNRAENQETVPAAPNMPAAPEDDSPQTGDHFPVWVCTALAGISGAGIFFIFYKRKRY